MRHPATRGHLVTQSSFGAESQLVLRGLTVNDELRATRVFRRHVCSGAISLFTHNKQKAQITPSTLKQAFSGRDHGSDDALRVAGAAAPDRIFILTGRKEWRHGVHVSGQDNCGVTKTNEHIVAVRFHWHALSCPLEASG